MSRRVRIELMVAVVLGVIAGVIHVSRLVSRQPTETPAPPRGRAAFPQLPEPKLDPRLLISVGDIKATVSADSPPYATRAVPLNVTYWDEKEPWVMMEPATPQKLVEDKEPIIWHAWTADGEGIIYATRDRVCVRRLNDSQTRTLVEARPIDKVYISSDRKDIAVASGRNLLVATVESGQISHHVFPSRVRSAAWRPNSHLIACSTSRTIWLVEPGEKPRALKSYSTMRDTMSDDTPKPRRVYAVDSLAWSPSGRYLGYNVWVRDTWGEAKPYVVAFDTRSGRDHMVQEGFSEADRYFAWGPAEDWMALDGNLGDVDSSVSVRRVWGEDEYQVNFGGASERGESMSLRPGTLEMAYLRYEGYSDVCVNGLHGANLHISWILLTVVIGYPEAEHKLKSAMAASLRRDRNPKIAPAESGIPDFDWSSDGSMYTFVERHYSFHQWADAEGRDPHGRWLGLLRIASLDSEQQVVAWSRQHPSEPRFSPDGTRVSYISGGDIWVRYVINEKRSEAQATYWREKGEKRFALGNLDGSVSALRNSVRHDPKDKRAHRLLAKAYTRLAYTEKNPYRRYAFLSAAVFEGEQAGVTNAFLKAHLNASAKAAHEYEAKSVKR